MCNNLLINNQMKVLRWCYWSSSYTSILWNILIGTRLIVTFWDTFRVQPLHRIWKPCPEGLPGLSTMTHQLMTTWYIKGTAEAVPPANTLVYSTNSHCHCGQRQHGLSQFHYINLLMSSDCIFSMSGGFYTRLVKTNLHLTEPENAVCL